VTETNTPTFVFDEIFQAFKEFATAAMARKGEPAAMILVVPWAFDAPFPPGAVVTRSGQLSPRELLTCAKQLRVMADKLYTMLASSLEAMVEEQARAGSGKQDV
jgi:hypothetical protein